jgi:hypothetical protein
MSAQFTATGARLDSVLALVQTGKGTLGKVRHRLGPLLEHGAAHRFASTRW